MNNIFFLVLQLSWTKKKLSSFFYYSYKVLPQGLSWKVNLSSMMGVTMFSTVWSPIALQWCVWFNAWTKQCPKILPLLDGTTTHASSTLGWSHVKMPYAVLSHANKIGNVQLVENHDTDKRFFLIKINSKKMQEVFVKQLILSITKSTVKLGYIILNTSNQSELTKWVFHDQLVWFVLFLHYTTIITHSLKGTIHLITLEHTRTIWSQNPAWIRGFRVCQPQNRSYMDR